MARSLPNIIFILSDDQGAWALGSAGNTELRTPNLDRLAREGQRYENFFCASPVCSPARASILTGRIPSQHGVHDWLKKGNVYYPERDDIEPIEYLAGLTGYTDHLAEAGYGCGLAGKWHLGHSAEPQKSHSFWKVHGFGGGSYYNAPLMRGREVYHEPRYVSDVFTDWGFEFLDQAEQTDSPFYLGLHYTAPHSPWTRDDHPHDLWDDYYENCPFESVPEEPMHPWRISAAPGGTGETRRRHLAGYFAAITAMDRNIGRLLNRLNEKGLRENTLIMFTSDNGMNMGHHGIWGKGNGTFPQNMYDTSVKVPFIASWPGTVPQGEVREELVSHYDIMPTLLDLIEKENPDASALPGRSFAGILKGSRQLPGRDSNEVIIYDEYGPVRMIRTTEWKYVHRFPYGPHELYHLASDPNERRNLVRNEQHAETREELKARLDDWFVRYADPNRDGAREGVTGKGQSGLAGPRGAGKQVWETGIRFLTPDGEQPATAYSPFSETP